MSDHGLSIRPLTSVEVATPDSIAFGLVEAILITRITRLIDPSPRNDQIGRKDVRIVLPPGEGEHMVSLFKRWDQTAVLIEVIGLPGRNVREVVISSPKEKH